MRAAPWPAPGRRVQLRKDPGRNLQIQAPEEKRDSKWSRASQMAGTVGAPQGWSSGDRIREKPGANTPGV